jgi:hypothetical protein
VSHDLVNRRWRTGRKVYRTIYAMQGTEPSDYDILIGVMDTASLATEVVQAHNLLLPAQLPMPGQSQLDLVEH